MKVHGRRREEVPQSTEQNGKRKGKGEGKECAPTPTDRKPYARTSAPKDPRPQSPASSLSVGSD